MNFIACVRNRKHDELNAEILEGHLSSTLCHLGNISYRLGANSPFSTEVAALSGDPHAGEALETMKKHLADAAGVKLDDAQYRVGQLLNYDAKAEKFVDNDEANKLLTRNYRKPYVVPQEV